MRWDIERSTGIFRYSITAGRIVEGVRPRLRAAPPLAVGHPIGKPGRVEPAHVCDRAVAVAHSAIWRAARNSHHAIFRPGCRPVGIRDTGNIEIRSHARVVDAVGVCAIGVGRIQKGRVLRNRHVVLADLVAGVHGTNTTAPAVVGVAGVPHRHHRVVNRAGRRRYGQQARHYEHTGKSQIPFHFMILSFEGSNQSVWEREDLCAEDGFHRPLFQKKTRW